MGITGMPSTDVFLSQSETGRWTIRRGGSDAPVRSFAVREHGLAYARAVACSVRGGLHVMGRHGRYVPQLPASLTYPSRLD